jgi:hypothetical protein
LSFRGSLLPPPGDAPSRTEVPPAWLPWTAAALAAVLLQSALAGLLGPQTIRASLAGLLVLWFGFRGGPWRGALFGAGIGIVEDSLAGSAVAWLCANAIAGAAAGLLRRTIVAETIVYMSIAAAVLSLVRLELFRLFVRVDAGPASSAGTSTLHALAAAAVSGLVAFAVLLVASRIQNDHGDA